MVLQDPSLQGSCLAADMPSAVTSPACIIVIEAADPLAELSTTVTVFAADALPTSRHASSNVTQPDSISA